MQQVFSELDMGRVSWVRVLALYGLHRRRLLLFALFPHEERCVCSSHWPFVFLFEFRGCILRNDVWIHSFVVFRLSWNLIAHCCCVLWFVVLFWLLALLRCTGLLQAHCIWQFLIWYSYCHDYVFNLNFIMPFLVHFSSLMVVWCCLMFNQPFSSFQQLGHFALMCIVAFCCFIA